LFFSCSPVVPQLFPIAGNNNDLGLQLCHQSNSITYILQMQVKM
jgi:hypothetical protein